MIYKVILKDETQCEFCVEIDADSKTDVENECEDMYPESNLVEILSPDEEMIRVQRLDTWANQLYDREIEDDYY